MVLRTIVWLSLLLELQCYPHPRKVPNLDVSSPQEVNSLEQDEPIARAINPTKKENKIEDTIKEVEEIIKSDATLPRLTRGEILDLLENITKTDAQKLNIFPKSRNPKSIMVVMPYTPDSDKNMEDLYTKAPVTHIINAEPFKNHEETSKTKHSRRRPPVQVNVTKKPFDNDVQKSTVANDEVHTYSPARQHPRERPAVTADKKRNELIPTTYHPTTTFTTHQPKTRRPVRRRATTTVEPRFPNHRYPDDFVPSGGIKIIDSPNLNVPQQRNHTDSSNLKLPELVIREKYPTPTFVVTTQGPTKKYPTSTFAVTTKAPTKAPTKATIHELHVPESLKNVMKDLNVEAALNPPRDVPKDPLDEQERLKEMLASIGVLPESSITTTTTTLLPNAENVAESLSPDMRDLLMSFGLLPNPNEKPSLPESSDQYYPEKADVKPESYTGFKPLPEDGPARGDMDALLAAFGLGRSARKQKSIKVNDSKPEYNLDIIPDNMKGVIGDLGLSESNRDDKKISSSSVQKTAAKQHVFNPDTQYATDEELRKLEKLMSVIKQLEKINGTASEEDLKQINLQDLKDLVGSLNGSSNETFLTLDQKEVDSPNPNDFDVGISKNEVKRQEENITITATTEEPRTPSIVDLEASFGGQTEVATEPPVPATTTRRTGFYYLIDWNTFLDIDDMKGRRVNLRFQPTIGDPKRFRTVSVP